MLGELPSILFSLLSLFLELDLDNPFVEVFEAKKNETFIAKESNIFEEEKRVAESAPIDEILMNDLSEVQMNTKKKS